MRAVVCRVLTGVEDLALDDIPVPNIAPSSVRIAMRVAAINPPDGLMSTGHYQVRPEVPFVLGLEGAGVVEEVGTNVTSLHVGDRVMTYAGLGCFAEEVVVTADRVFRIPDEMHFSEAAGFALGYGTTYHALVDRASISSDDVVVVLGAGGGLGICAIQLAKSFGAKVIAVATAPEKRAAALENGADWSVHGSDDELKAQIIDLTGGIGATIIHDTVGGDQTMAALRSLAPYGRHLIVGYASGSVPQIPANYILLKQVSVIGVSFRQHVQNRPIDAAVSVTEAIGRWSSGDLQPRIFETYALENYKVAISRLSSRDVVGKVNLEIKPLAGPTE